MAAAEGPDPLFADLLTCPGCPIPRTELRSISLDQLGLVVEHIDRRLTGGEVWRVDRYDNGVKSQVDLTDPQLVTLYDTCARVIKPVSEKQQLSLVEAMGAGPVSPDYFVSHWYHTPRGLL